MAAPQPTLVELLVRHVLLPRELLTLIEINSGIQPHHLLCCDALGLDRSWYEAPSAHKSARGIQTP